MITGERLANQEYQLNLFKKTQRNKHIRNSTSTHRTEKHASLYAGVETERILSVYSQPTEKARWYRRHVVGSNLGPAKGFPR